MWKGHLSFDEHEHEHAAPKRHPVAPHQPYDKRQSTAEAPTFHANNERLLQSLCRATTTCTRTKAALQATLGAWTHTDAILRRFQYVSQDVHELLQHLMSADGEDTAMVALRAANACANAVRDVRRTLRRHVAMYIRVPNPMHQRRVTRTTEALHAALNALEDTLGTVDAEKRRLLRQSQRIAKPMMTSSTSSSGAVSPR